MSSVKFNKKLFKWKSTQKLHLTEMDESGSEEECAIDAVSYDGGTIKSCQRKVCPKRLFATVKSNDTELSYQLHIFTE